MQKEGKKEKKKKEEERNEIRIHAIQKQIGGEKNYLSFPKQKNAARPASI